MLDCAPTLPCRPGLSWTAACSHAIPALLSSLRSLLTAIHFAQCHRSKRFQMYDYGPRINFQIYGQRTPIDVGAQYFRLKVPVDLIAGTRDGVITRENIQASATAVTTQAVQQT